MNDRRRDDEHLERLADGLIGDGDGVEVPVDRLWRGIDAVRDPRRRLWAAAAAGQRVRPAPRLARLRAPIAALAILALGIALGRLTLEDHPPEGTPFAATEPASHPAGTTESAAADLVIRHASTAVFTRAEALLTDFRASADTTGQERVRRWAAVLLTETRLLLDTPAATDAEVGFLLRDLELVLAQIVQMNPAHADDDRRWITRGMNERATLLHLRAALPAGGAVADL